MEIYSQNVTQYTSPIYSNTNEFLNYNLDVPVYLPAGTYYFGWEKISAPFLNVGWDLNTNNSSKVHFNSVGVWQTASFSGSLMLRPVFGSNGEPQQVNIAELSEEDELTVYPNPASTLLNIVVPLNKNYSIELIDLNGKTLIQSSTAISKIIDVSSFANGIYLVKLINNKSGSIFYKKVVITK